MAMKELLSALRELSHGDKLRVMQFLVFELAREEDSLLAPGMAYPVWSPYDALEAADTLLSVLKEAGDSLHA